jgi:NitT/TauT family transport system substrate-binding protein
VVSARAANSEVIDCYTTLREPEALGGKLPPDDFYFDL